MPPGEPWNVLVPGNLGLTAISLSGLVVVLLAINGVAPHNTLIDRSVVTAKDLDAMLQTAVQDQTPEGLRLTLILEMLYGGGLRVSELAGMPLAAVRTKENFIRVTGKGNKERLSPLSPAARIALDAYLDAHAAAVDLRLAALRVERPI